MTARWQLMSLCLLALLAHAACQSSTSGPVITSVSGCVDAGSMTTECVLPVWLTVRGSGFLTNAASAGPAYVSSPASWISVRPDLTPAAIARGGFVNNVYISRNHPANDTYFVYQLVYLGQGVFNSDPIALTVVAGRNTPSLSTTSPPFAAITLASVPPPTVTGLSGCPVQSADGRSTSQCLPDVNLLTVTGSGFLQWESAPLELYIGGIQQYIYLSLGTASAAFYYNYNYIVNDTALVISLMNVYDQLLQVHDFGAPPQDFYFQERLSLVQSAHMSVQFAALPPLSYSSISPVNRGIQSLPACQWGANQSTLVNCTAGYAPILIRGSYLYEVTATIGGLPMTPSLDQQPTAKQLWLSAPVFNFQPGVLYDIVLTSARGNITVPNYISFSGVPAIVSAACRDPLLPNYVTPLACQPGETVTMNGVYLPPISTDFTVTVFSLASQQNVSCASPRYNSAYQLACDMLEAGLPATGGWDTWYLQWANGLSLTLADRYDAWDYPTAPRIRYITATGGCGNVVMSSNVTLSGCAGGELLQLYGTHFLSQTYVMAIQPTISFDYYFYNNVYFATCEELSVVNDTYATCILPQVEDYAGLSYDTPLTMFMWNRTSQYRSNALFFSLVNADTTVGTSTSSAPSLALLVALPVSLAVLAVVLIVATVRQLRSKARSTRAGPYAESSDVHGEQKEAERGQAENSGGWWRSKPTLASQEEVRSVELTESDVA